MPVLSLAEIASRATQLAGGEAWTLSEVSFYTNIAQEIVAQDARLMHGPREALAVSSTTSGGNRITFPTDYDYARAITIGVASTSTATTSRTTTWKPLAKHDADWADTFSGNQDGGEPEAYIEYATWLELVPSPNSAYSMQLRYVTDVPVLVASTTTSILDQQWHWAMVTKTAELLAASRGAVELEQRNRGRYETYIASLRADQAKRRMDRRGGNVAYVRSLR